MGGTGSEPNNYLLKITLNAALTSSSTILRNKQTNINPFGVAQSPPKHATRIEETLRLKRVVTTQPPQPLATATKHPAP